MGRQAYLNRLALVSSLCGLSFLDFIFNCPDAVLAHLDWNIACTILFGQAPMGATATKVLASQFT